MRTTVETAYLGAEEGKPLSKGVLIICLSDRLGVVPNRMLEEARKLVYAVKEGNFSFGLSICSEIEEKWVRERKPPSSLEEWICFVGIAKAYFKTLQRKSGGLN